MVNECEIQSDNQQRKSFFIVLAEAPSFVVMRLSFRSRTRSPQRQKSLRLQQLQTTTSNGTNYKRLPRWSEIHWARSCSLVRLGNRCLWESLRGSCGLWRDCEMLDCIPKHAQWKSSALVALRWKEMILLTADTSYLRSCKCWCHLKDSKTMACKKYLNKIHLDWSVRY